LKGILLGKPQVELAELPALIKLHFPKEPKWCMWHESRYMLYCNWKAHIPFLKMSLNFFMLFFPPLDSSTTLV
jgi:hypothetical protein